MNIVIINFKKIFEINLMLYVLGYESMVCCFIIIKFKGIWDNIYYCFFWCYWWEYENSWIVFLIFFVKLVMWYILYEIVLVIERFVLNKVSFCNIF